MNRKSLVAVGAVAVLAGAGAVWAAGGHHGFRKGMMQHMISARIAEAEDLIQATPQQRAQIDQSKEVIVNALQARAKDRRQDHAQLVQILTADKLDQNALYGIANQHAQEIQDLAKVIVPEIQKVHDVLTPQQRQTLAQKAQEMQQKHQQHQQQGGFGGPGE
jgi:Spy/CpxP family protein refolding chaperone